MTRRGCTLWVAALALIFSSVHSDAGDAVSLPAPTPEMYGTGRWDGDSLGTHRVLLRVREHADAVRTLIPWRRRDLHPEQKTVWIIHGATGERITNVRWLALNREYGDVVFEPRGGPGIYELYYLLYRSTGSRNYPKGFYLPFMQTADSLWLRTHHLDGLLPLNLDSLPRADVVQFQSIDSLNSFFPMEIIATSDEVKRVREEGSREDFLLFPEDRSRPIKMTSDLPFRWTERGHGLGFSGFAQRGEFYTFQIGVFAHRSQIAITGVRMSDLRGPGTAFVAASRFTCFNTEGTDWAGTRWKKSVAVTKGNVQALWMGVQLPDHIPAGTYTGTIVVTAAGAAPKEVPFSLTVAEETAVHGGDDDPMRLTRLRWLNSQHAVDDSLIKPFTPVQVRGALLSVLGRSMRLAATGLPEQITSFFAPGVTHLVAQGRDLLTGAVRFRIIDNDGKESPWRSNGVHIVRASPGAVSWESTSLAGQFDISISGTMECDGYVDFRVTIIPREEVSLRDIRLEIPLQNEVMRYMMGLGVKGGIRPTAFDWNWNRQKNQDAIWLGDVNAGVQCSFRDTNYERPLNTNFYLSKPLAMPPSWWNQGKGRVQFSPAGTTLMLVATGGQRTATAHAPLHFYFTLLLTPFKPLDTEAQWSTRFYHKFESLDTISTSGANTINVHHATPVNPYINYPFLRPAAMKSYVDQAHARGFRVKIYYTVRELTNRAPELFALRSLGDEILANGPGGGCAWLQEHLDTTYLAGWFVPELNDAALITSGVSRWHNYYVEGLQWLVDHLGIDGLYIDDVAFDRTTMKRVRKVLDRGRPAALIDLHSANQFNPRDGYANSANLYLEHFPYLDRLWLGEYFDYNASPDYWLVEVSGIPFGLMGEMLEKGGNPWRGMLYGMTSRLPWAGDPTPVWRIWDSFGMERTRMIGYWSPTCPVTTDHPDVRATVYQKPGRALIALASWSSDTVRCRLGIDWQALNISAGEARFVAMESKGFQEARVFQPDEAIPIAPGKGWLLAVSKDQK